MLYLANILFVFFFSYCEVMVSAIVNPTKFFVQKAGPVSSELDRLNDEMTVFFTDESNRQPFSAGPDVVLSFFHFLT